MAPTLGKLYRIARKIAGNPGLVLPRKRPLETTPDIDGNRFLFVAGLHRSGTSILHRLLRAHPDISGFANTRVPEDEGQYLQSVYPREAEAGGPGQFAFDPRAHLTENSPLVSEANRDKLLREWAPYYDLDRTFLLEKTPTNLIRSRFLQALLPGCRFVFIVRHPIVSGLSTFAWTRRSGIGLGEVMTHWVKAHQLFLGDLAYLQNWTLIRYEDLVADPASTMADVFGFLGLDAVAEHEAVRDRNQRYFDKWESDAVDTGEALAALDGSGHQFCAKFGYQLSQPYVGDPAPLLESPTAA